MEVRLVGMREMNDVIKLTFYQNNRSNNFDLITLDELVKNYRVGQRFNLTLEEIKDD